MTFGNENVVAKDVGDICHVCGLKRSERLFPRGSNAILVELGRQNDTLWNVGKGSEPMFRRRYVELRQFMADRERLVLDLRAGRGQ